MKVSKTVVCKYWDKVLAAHKYFWYNTNCIPYGDDKLIEDNKNSIKLFSKVVRKRKWSITNSSKKLMMNTGLCLKAIVRKNKPN